MLIKNMDEMNVNGSMGTIVEFIEPQNYLTNPDDPFTINTKPPSKPVPTTSQAVTPGLRGKASNNSGESTPMSECSCGVGVRERGLEKRWRCFWV